MPRISYSWLILATGFVVLFFSGGSRFAFGLMLKPMTDELGWSRSSLSLSVTAFMVVSALTLPFVGRLVDRYGPRWIIASGSLISAVGIGLMGRVVAHWQVFALYGFVYGVGHAGTSVASMGVMISRWFPRRRGVANSVAISGNATGQLIIITVLAAFLTTLGWRTSFAILGAANVAIVVPLVLATVRSDDQTQREDGNDSLQRGDAGPGPLDTTARSPATDDVSQTVTRVLATRQLWILVVIYAACGIQDFFIATHVVAFALDQAVDSVLAGNLLAMMGLMGLFGVLSAGILADAHGAWLPTVLCFVIRIGIFVLIIYSQDTPSIIVFALVYGFTFPVTAPLVVVFTANFFGTKRLGTVSSLFNMVHQSAGGLGAFVGAFIFDRWGSYDGAFVLMLALSLLGAAATLLVRDRPMVQSTAAA